jgi:hypothetical protein
MAAAKEKKKAATTVDKSEINKEHLEFINKNYPLRKFFTRKICHLWDNFYRVNFHNSIDIEHKIEQSYWVEVPDVKKQTKQDAPRKA